ncbi:uncharacterized protein LOC119394065 [Rhipicephalus sanguineus]|uniref:uncharacterized protein LOC119394065 n=1 Tax=Rhipicephalus sanguineus TaxID=34632 RepID=UPI001895C927|nr:uncharacterized protein LOC119394065 [Rhipicephalus sanguineus]
MPCACCIIWTVFLVFVVYETSNAYTFPEMRKSGTYLTVSYDHFELNWFGVRQDYIGKTLVLLSRYNPPRCLSDILALCAVKTSSGKHKTSVLAKNFKVSVLMRGMCLGYWALIVKNRNSSEIEMPWTSVKQGKKWDLPKEASNTTVIHLTQLLSCFPKDVSSSKGQTPSCVEVLYSSCFTPKPRWMRDNYQELSSLSLMDMLIPGTHDAGMYHQGTPLPHEKLLYNQDRTIKQQLAYGIRALDLRVQYSRGEFYITHDRVRGWPTVSEVLRDVREFVDETGEIVILDFHRFTVGFDEGYDDVPARHLQLQHVIMQQLGGVLLKRFDYFKKLEEIFGDSKNGLRLHGHVIAFYRSNYFRGPYANYLAPAILHRWANAKSLKELMKYMREKACVSGTCNLISVMAELTPSFPKLIVSPRRAAKWVNHDVTEFFRHKQRTCSGIVSTDFFLGNGMIDVTIEANILRGRDRQFLQKEKPYSYCDTTVAPAKKS